jgi:hypothetical protein
VTANSTAACGVPIEKDAVYLVFATRQTDSPHARFDTCSGSRRFDPDAPAADASFVDTAPDQISAALDALADDRAPGGAKGVAGVALPIAGNPNADLIGLLVLPALAVRSPIGAFRSPDSQPTTIKADDVVTREAGYEQPAAVVRERRGRWFRISLTHGREVWVETSEDAFKPVSELLVNRLTYLNQHWDGMVWPEPGAGYPQKSARKLTTGRQEVPVKITASEVIGDSLWLRIEVLDRDPCGDGEAKTTDAGWVSAYTAGGKLVDWFHSRGC